MYNMENERNSDSLRKDGYRDIITTGGELGLEVSGKVGTPAARREKKQ